VLFSQGLRGHEPKTAATAGGMFLPLCCCVLSEATAAHRLKGPISDLLGKRVRQTTTHVAVPVLLLSECKMVCPADGLLLDAAGRIDDGGRLPGGAPQGETLNSH
jgi:hypothetical protein